MGAPSLIGQTGSYESSGATPLVDTLGDAIAGYRTAATANSAGDLPDGTRAIIAIYKQGEYNTNAIWLAEYTHGSPGYWTQVTALCAIGTLADEDAVDVYVVAGGNLITNQGETYLDQGTITTAVTLDVADAHVHKVTTTSGTGCTITLENTHGHVATALTLHLVKAGTETITWAGDFNNSTGWVGGTAPTLAADTHVIQFLWLGSASTCYAVYLGTL